MRTCGATSLLAAVAPSPLQPMTELLPSITVGNPSVLACERKLRPHHPYYLQRPLHRPPQLPQSMLVRLVHNHQQRLLPAQGRGGGHSGHQQHRRGLGAGWGQRRLGEDEEGGAGADRCQGGAPVVDLQGGGSGETGI